MGYTRNSNLTNDDTKLNYDITHKQMSAQWIDPSDFITQHQLGPIAQNPDGTVDFSFLTAFAAYNCANPASHYFLGQAKDNGGSPFVHDWYGYQVQDFEKGILVQNPLTKEVFPVVGGFYQVWLGTGDPRIYGAPKEAERYDTNWAEQEFEKATFRWDGERVMVFVNGQLVVIRQDENGYDTLTSPDVFMALLPVNGSTLNLLAYAKSADSIIVSGSWILGAVRYQVFREGQYAGDLDANLNFVDSGLVSATAYRYYLVALDSFGRTLTTSLEVSATTMAQNLI